MTILASHINDSAGMTRAERDEAVMPFTYTIRFSDGLTWCAFEDELSETPEEWFRPDPPTQDTPHPSQSAHNPKYPQ